jgi:osmotically-inducible protein OsmY
MTRDLDPATHPADAEVFAAARRALDGRPSIPATVRVHVNGGVAWLTGTVRSAAERLEAESVVHGVAGVRRVVNTLVVGAAPDPTGLEPPGVTQ